MSGWVAHKVFDLSELPSWCSKAEVFCENSRNRTTIKTLYFQNHWNIWWIQVYPQTTQVNAGVIPLLKHDWSWATYLIYDLPRMSSKLGLDLYVGSILSCYSSVMYHLFSGLSHSTLGGEHSREGWGGSAGATINLITNSRKSTTYHQMTFTSFWFLTLEKRELLIYRL